MYYLIIIIFINIYNYVYGINKISYNLLYMQAYRDITKPIRIL